MMSELVDRWCCGWGCIRQRVSRLEVKRKKKKGVSEYIKTFEGGKPFLKSRLEKSIEETVKFARRQGS